MDFKTLAIGAAVGTGAHLLYRSSWDFNNAMITGKSLVMATPAWLVLPIGGAWVGQNYLSSISTMIPAWGWAAVGSNLAVMFLTDPLLNMMAPGEAKVAA